MKILFSELIQKANVKKEGIMIFNNNSVYSSTAYLELNQDGLQINFMNSTNITKKISYSFEEYKKIKNYIILFFRKNLNFPSIINNSNISCFLIQDLIYNQRLGLKHLNFSEFCSNESSLITLEWVIEYNRYFFQSLLIRLQNEENVLNIKTLIKLITNDFFVRLKKNDFENLLTTENSFLALFLGEICNGNFICNKIGLEMLKNSDFVFNSMNFKDDILNTYIYAEIINNTKDSQENEVFLQRPSEKEILLAINTIKFAVNDKNISIIDIKKDNLGGLVYEDLIKKECINYFNENINFGVFRKIALIPLLYNTDIFTEFTKYVENYNQS